MLLKSMRLIVIELKQSLKVFTDNKRKYEDWEIEPNFEGGFNSDKRFILNITIEVIRTIGIQHATIKVLTSFELDLASDRTSPESDEEFLEYASFQQIAVAHARALFLREARGTKFANSIVPMDALYHALQKVKLAFSGSGRSN